jgi:transcriptional regulator with XRE-family HTH domain
MGISPLGQKLLQLRERNGLSQRALAIRSEIPQSTISRLEKGYLQTVGILTAKKLAKVLKVTIDFLVFENEDSFDGKARSDTSYRIITAVVDNSPQKVVIVDLDGTTLFANFTPAQIGKNISEFVEEDPSDYIRGVANDGDNIRALVVGGQERGCSFIPILDEFKKVDMVMLMFDAPVELVKS